MNVLKLVAGTAWLLCCTCIASSAEFKRWKPENTGGQAGPNFAVSMGSFAKETKVRLQIVKVGSGELELYSWNPKRKRIVGAYGNLDNDDHDHGGNLDPMYAWQVDKSTENKHPNRNSDPLAEDQIIEVKTRHAARGVALFVRKPTGTNGFIPWAITNVEMKEDGSARVEAEGGWVVDIKVVREKL